MCVPIAAVLKPSQLQFIKNFHTQKRNQSYIAGKKCFVLHICSVHQERYFKAFRLIYSMFFLASSYFIYRFQGVISILSHHFIPAIFILHLVYKGVGLGLWCYSHKTVVRISKITWVRPSDGRKFCWDNPDQDSRLSTSCNWAWKADVWIKDSINWILLLASSACWELQLMCSEILLPSCLRLWLKTPQSV